MWIRVILVGLVLAVCLYFVNSLTGKVADAEKRATESERMYQELKTKHAEEVNKVLRDNTEKLKKATDERIASEVQYNLNIQKLQLDRQRESKALKELYENRLSSTTRNWSERLRLELEKRGNSSVSGVSESSVDTRGLTEGERECYGAYSTLEKACQITTVDFNRCRAWMDTTCNTIGCESN